jgi:hypothetical protein
MKGMKFIHFSCSQSQKAKVLGRKDVRVPPTGSYITIRTTENIPLLANRSKDLALLDNITICDRVMGSFETLLGLN